MMAAASARVMKRARLTSLPVGPPHEKADGTVRISALNHLLGPVEARLSPDLVRVGVIRQASPSVRLLLRLG